MTFRSFLLVACMLVVPALAMFSHRIPPAARKTVWRAWSEPVANCVAWIRDRFPVAADAGGGSPAPEPAGLADAGPLPRTADSRSMAAAGELAQPRVAPGPPASADAALLESEFASRLAAHGATSIECRSMQGQEQNCVASCHVAIDESGQLFRVFQAAGPGREAAFRGLLDTVVAWRARRSAGDRLGWVGATDGAARR